MVWDGEAPVEKNGAEEKMQVNDDWRKDFAWIANMADNGMAQCNLCMTDFSIGLSSGGHTGVRRHQESARHAKLAKSMGSTKPSQLFVEGWDGPI